MRCDILWMNECTVLMHCLPYLCICVQERGWVHCLHKYPPTAIIRLVARLSWRSPLVYLCQSSVLFACYRQKLQTTTRNKKVNGAIDCCFTSSLQRQLTLIFNRVGTCCIFSRDVQRVGVYFNIFFVFFKAFFKSVEFFKNRNLHRFSKAIYLKI